MRTINDDDPFKMFRANKEDSSPVEYHSSESSAIQQRENKQNGKQQNEYQWNGYAEALDIIGWIVIVIGTIASIYYILILDGSIVGVFIGILSGCASGFFFFGMGEIIRLLDKIHRKINDTNIMNEMENN